MTRTREREREGDGKKTWYSTKKPALRQSKCAIEQSIQSIHSISNLRIYIIFPSKKSLYWYKNSHVIYPLLLRKKRKAANNKKAPNSWVSIVPVLSFPPNKMLLLGSTEPTGCIKICQMLASAFSQSRCGETNGSPFFLFSSGYFSTWDFLSNQTSTKKTEWEWSLTCRSDAASKR